MKLQGINLKKKILNKNCFNFLFDNLGYKNESGYFAKKTFFGCIIGHEKCNLMRLHVLVYI